VEGPREGRILKRSPARSVRLEPASGGGASQRPRVVKRFASRRLFAAALDRSRARREPDLLAQLSALGLPVPRPLALEARDGGWELAMEWIAQAQPFSAVLAGHAPWPVPPEVLARELGALHARLLACGIEHPDLHPGNALVDATGRVWAIDFHKARRAGRPSPARLEAQLAHLAAGVRERLSRRFRARFLWSWWRTLRPDLRPAAQALPLLAARVEARARRKRLADVERRRLRWTRAGSAVRRVQLAGGKGFERADREEGLARALEAAIARSGVLGPRAILPCSLDPARRSLVLSADWRTVSSAWYVAARLEEHALPAARPLAIARGERTWAAFELPAHGHAPSSWGELRDRRLLRALGALAAALHDRGLRPARLVPDILWIDERARVQLSCLNRVAPALELSPARALEPWYTALGADSSERAALIAGFSGALDLSRAERAALRADLRRG